MATVPCAGCTLCCEGDAVRLLPGDDSSQYKTVPHERYEGQLMLAHKPNGDCIYLDGGCSIHDRKPIMCQQMDCRNVSNQYSYTEARTLGIIKVWKRGKVI